MPQTDQQKRQMESQQKSQQKSQLNQSVLVFAHGAGADKDSEWMVNFDELLSAQGLSVERFNFPYMQKRARDGKRRPPDRAPKLIEAFEQQLDKLDYLANLANDKKMIIGGKSMGGRMASLLAVESRFKDRLSGVICLGFPFHPPKKPEKFKAEHLANIEVPTLILQGERDTMGDKAAVANFTLSSKVQLTWVADGDHSFKPRVKSGKTLASNLQFASEQVIAFINAQSKKG